jgi:hypothetical protein
MNDRWWQIVVFLIVVVALVWAATQLGFHF